MNIQFTARHFHASESLRDNITDRAEDLTKFYENIISAHIILDAEDTLRQKAEVVVSTRKKSIAGKAQDEKMGRAIDAAFDKVERQLKKINEKIKGHKEKGLKNSLPDD
ncbi:MAG: ribosome-associated translation inhibitor RaiA [Fibrobacterota bacterium]